MALAHAGVAAPGFPRIANLWGYGPTAVAAEYERLARYDLLVMGGGPPETWRVFARELRRRNPEILLFGTAPLTNIAAPADTPWMRDEWYLCRPDGGKVNWWAGLVYVPNLRSDDCLTALLEQTEKGYGDLLRDGSADGVLYDSVVGRASWLGDVDTDRDGIADKAAEVDPLWLQRQNLFFDRFRERWPQRLILANDVDGGHAAHLHGRLLEGGVLLDRMLNGDSSAKDAIQTLSTWMSTTRQPGVTFALMTHPVGWQGWRVGKGNQVTTPGEVERVRRDFARMRTGLCTTLMTDAYYAYDLGTVWYGLPFWYAEYDAPLGEALGPAQAIFDVAPAVLLDWAAGQAADALRVDPVSQPTASGLRGTQGDPNAGWARLFGTDPAAVHFAPGHVFRIEADVEILAKPSGTLQFNLRSGRGGWEHHDKGVSLNPAASGQTWHLDVTVVPDDFDDYAAEWHLNGAGDVCLTKLRITQIDQCYYRRDFAGGIAVLNAVPRPATIDLKGEFTRLRDDAAPAWVVEVDDAQPGFSCQGAWERVAGEVHACGDGYRQAAKPGDTARWAFVAPAADTYTILACVPGGKGAATAAAYAAEAGPATVRQTLDQRSGDGGWVRLFELKLAAAETCTVVLTSSGVGATQADALRAESARRYNDGGRVAQLTLGPLGGVVLLRP